MTMLLNKEKLIKQLERLVESSDPTSCRMDMIDYQMGENYAYMHIIEIIENGAFDVEAK